MKSKIIKDLLFDAIVVAAIVEGIMFAIWYCAVNYLPASELTQLIEQYYVLSAVVVAVGLILFYVFNAMLCLKKYRCVIRSQGISDSTYYECYCSARKCCNYRVHGDLVFVNTTHGIICMEKNDIIDKRTKRVKHTKSTRRVTRYGGTRSVYHAREYYTYHFDLITKYGHFKNTVSNADVLSDLQLLFAY